MHASSARPRPAICLLRLLFALALLAVLAGSLLPPAALPPLQTGWDKADHALAWLGLALLGMAAWPRRAFMVLGGLLVFGSVVELLQSLTRDRHAEWADLLADAVGVAAALLLRQVMRRFARHRAKPDKAR